MPVFAEYTFDDVGQTAADSAAGDGARGGIYLNGAAATDGRVVLDGQDDLVKIYSDPAFQMDTGTLAIDFTQGRLADTGASTLLSRDSVGATDGGFHIDILSDGSIQVFHETAAGDPVVFATGAGFVAEGDQVSIGYSWELGGEGGRLTIANATQGSSFGADVPNTVTMDQGSISKPWMIGAGQSLSNPNDVNDLNQHFNGSVGSFTLSDTVDNPGANRDPLANPDTASTAVGTAVTIPVTANDSDPDGDPLTVTGATATNGSVTVNDDGSITYVPNAGFVGTDEISYAVSDGNGGSATATVSVAVGDQAAGGARDGIVWGTAGNDYIDAYYAGDNDGDVVDGGDAILPGAVGNDDEIHAGVGNDVVMAGDGNDLVYGGPGDDTIFGGAGNDTLHADGGDNLVVGDDGDDLIVGGTGDDQLLGGAGDDTIRAGSGSALVHGDDGNDLIIGGAGDDSLNGDAGNDTIFGGDAAEVEIFGGSGDDALYAGAGGTLVLGGEGNDSLYGGAGLDVLFGGADRDVIMNVGLNDVIDGNEEGDDYDTLDLTGAGPLRVEYDPDNSENGTVYFLDSDGNVTGTASFINIENVIPCFTPGALIATPKGEVAVESLREGDKIITRDNGIQEIRWVGARTMSWSDLTANPHLRPVLIRQGSLGHGLPERDMMVSPNHRMLVANDRTQLYFDEHEVLVAAKHLVGGRGIQSVEAIGATYIHFMFDRHEVVLADGAWTESFQPGDYTLKGMGNAQRGEIYELFPELKTVEGVRNYTAARRTLRRHEAALLVK